MLETVFFASESLEIETGAWLNKSIYPQFHLFFFFFTLPTSHLAKKQTFGPLLQQQVFPGRWLACSFACILGRHLLPWVIFWSVLVLPRSKLFTWVLNSSKQTLSPFRKDHAFIPWSLLGAQGRRNLHGLQTMCLSAQVHLLLWSEQWYQSSPVPKLPS